MDRCTKYSIEFINENNAISYLIILLCCIKKHLRNILILIACRIITSIQLFRYNTLFLPFDIGDQNIANDMHLQLNI